MAEALTSQRLTAFLEAMQGDLVGLFADRERLGELGGALAGIAAPDLVCLMVGGEPGPTNEESGLEGVVRAWNDWLEPWERYDLKVEDVIRGEDATVALVRVHARTKTGGVEVEHAPAAVFRFREEMLTRLEFHLDRRVAFASAGLKPARDRR